MSQVPNKQTHLLGKQPSKIVQRTPTFHMAISQYYARNTHVPDSVSNQQSISPQSSALLTEKIATSAIKGLSLIFYRLWSVCKEEAKTAIIKRTLSGAAVKDYPANFNLSHGNFALLRT